MPHPPFDRVSLLQNVRPWGGAAVDIRIADGAITALESPAEPRDDAEDVDSIKKTAGLTTGGLVTSLLRTAEGGQWPPSVSSRVDS